MCNRASQLQYFQEVSREKEVIMKFQCSGALLHKFRLSTIGDTNTAANLEKCCSRDLPLVEAKLENRRRSID